MKKHDPGTPVRVSLHSALLAVGLSPGEIAPMKPRELTLRGLLLGVLLTFIFTAANVYLGLRVGLTFASSIPAAVISMAILSRVKNSSILENNIVQTVASAAGTLSAIIFILPGLVIVGWWVTFPFWQTFLICTAGGVLGVLFTIPLRRALVTNSDLPYPEGVAAAEVLKVGAGTRGETTDESGESREGLTARHPRLGSLGVARDPGGDAHRWRARSPGSSGWALWRRADTTSPSPSRCSASATSSVCRSGWPCCSGW